MWIFKYGKYQRHRFYRSKISAFLHRLTVLSYGQITTIMKKLTTAILALAILSLSFVFSQLAFQQKAVAKEQVIQNRFLYSISVDGDWQYWMANVDGTNHQQILINLPAPLKLGRASRLTPDGQQLIFPAYNPGTMEHFIYSWTFHGSILKKLVDATPGTRLEINEVF